MTAGITLAQAQTQLAAWLAADAALAVSQSYTIDTGNGSRTLTRANAEQVRENIKYWNGLVQQLSVAGTGRRRTRYVVPE